LSGNDILYGNEFNDSLYGGPGNDSLYGGANNDKLYGGPGNDYLSGGLDSDELYGEAGDDILDGSGGGSAGYIDTLIGGTGNDTYIVDTLEIIRGKFGDQITEKLNEGTDTVHSPISHKLGDNLENLVLTGSSDINGSGNALDNRIEGNAGQNFLVGGDGNDHLLGYAGNDILAGEAGNDTVSGGAGNDFLNGGAGSDTLTGGAGSDTLTGGAGADRFVFSSPSDGIDIIKDLSSVESDKIQISKTGFGATSTNQFSYNNNTGALSFQETQFATLESKPSFIPNLHIELV
jgi:Ca2+-binding RTX toxin-like protein